MSKNRIKNDEDLGEALGNYIDPEQPEYDADFTIKLMVIRPDWFTAEEREKISRKAEEN